MEQEVTTAYAPEEIATVLRFLAAARPAGYTGVSDTVDFASYPFPPELCRAIADDERLAWLHPALAANSATPPDVLERLLRRHMLAERHLLADARRYTLLQTLCARLVANPATPTDLLLQIAEDPRLAAPLADRLATHANFPVDRLPLIAPYIASRHELGRALARPGVTPALVQAVWQRMPRTCNLVMAVVSCPHAPSDVLAEVAGMARRIAGGRDAVALRERLALNRNTPPDILSRLAFDRHRVVRLAALGNPSVPADVLRRAYATSWRSRDPSSVQLKLAANPACPDDILLALVMSDFPTVAQEARKTMAARRPAA